MEHIDTNFSIVLYLLFEICTGLSYVFYFCYFGRQSTESYAQMGHCVYDIAWYSLPIELQKFIVLFIENSQIPLYYRGLNIITLDLETFNRVSYESRHTFKGMHNAQLNNL